MEGGTGARSPVAVALRLTPTGVRETIGLPTLNDIMQELAKPGLDPRGEAKAFSFDPNVKSIEDLREGMVLPGIVNNITNFGAFVDIGIKEGGLVHISQLANHRVTKVSDIVKEGDTLRVKVLEISRDGKIRLSHKAVLEEGKKGVRR